MDEQKIRSTIIEAMRTAKQQLIDNMGIDRFQERILDYPKWIREQQDQMTALSQQMKAAKSNLVAAEGLLLAEITAEIVPTGKAKYSNKEAREAELARRKQFDPECLAALKQYNEAEEAFNAAQFDLQQLQDEFRAYLTAGELLAAKISALR